MAHLKFKNSKMCRLVKWCADILKCRYSVLVPVLTKIFAVQTGTNEILSNGTFETLKFENVQAGKMVRRHFEGSVLSTGNGTNENFCSTNRY